MEREQESIDQSLGDLTTTLHGRQQSWMQKTALLEHTLFTLDRPYSRLHPNEQDLVDGLLAYVTDKKCLTPEVRSRATAAFTHYQRRHYVIAFPSPQKPTVVADKRPAYVRETAVLTPAPHSFEQTRQLRGKRIILLEQFLAVQHSCMGFLCCSMRLIQFTEKQQEKRHLLMLFT
jgi:hypothetical protein